MSATLVWRAVLISLLWTPWLAAQSGTPNSTTTCNLDDGRQVYVRYNAVANKEKPANGKPWAPGGAPMTLFTETQLAFGEFRDSDWSVHGVSHPGERKLEPGRE